MPRIHRTEPCGARGPPLTPSLLISAQQFVVPGAPLQIVRLGSRIRQDPPPRDRKHAQWRLHKRLHWRLHPEDGYTGVQRQPGGEVDEGGYMSVTGGSNPAVLT